MKWVILICLSLAACSSAPAPKVPPLDLAERPSSTVCGTGGTKPAPPPPPRTWQQIAAWAGKLSDAWDKKDAALMCERRNRRRTDGWLDGKVVLNGAAAKDVEIGAVAGDVIQRP